MYNCVFFIEMNPHVLLLHGTNREKVQRSIGSMQPVMKRKDDLLITEWNTKFYITTSKSLQNTTVGPFYWDSLILLICPKESTVTDNVICAAGVKYRVKGTGNGCTGYR